MKALILVLLSIWVLKPANAQNRPDTQMTYIKNVVLAALPVSADRYEHGATEFFIVDMQMDPETGALQNVGFFRNDSSLNQASIRRVVERLRTSWRPLKHFSKRILLPVYLLFDESLPQLSNPFYLRKQRNQDVYVCDELNIPVLARMH